MTMAMTTTRTATTTICGRCNRDLDVASDLRQLRAFLREGVDFRNSVDRVLHCDCRDAGFSEQRYCGARGAQALHALLQREDRDEYLGL